MKAHRNNPSEAYHDELKKQAMLFSLITKLNEETLSEKQLLEKAAGVITENWVNSKSILTHIFFGGNNYGVPDQKEYRHQVQSKSWVNGNHELLLKIFSHQEETFSEADKQLAQVIADTLCAKLTRIISQKELKAEQDFIDKAYKLAHIGTWEYDMAEEKLIWSDVTKEVHGFESDYVPDVESTILLFKEGYHRDSFAKAAMDAIEKEIPFDVEHKIISGKGDERWIRATGEPEYKDGACVRFYGISQDVTGRRQAEEEIELNDRRFKALVQHGTDLISILDEEANYIFASPNSSNVLGYPRGHFEGKNAFDFIHPDDKSRLLKQFSKIPKNESIQLKSFRFKDANGNWRWLESTITNLKDDPAVKGYVSNARDVTDRQIKQEQIIESLKEKETLLAEIHHRIKNNLSVLTGLLQLQAASENNEEVIARLFDSVARIQTMANIHEQLYQRSNFSSIEFADRIQLLALNIQKTFQTDIEVDLNFQCEAVELPINKALPCSLIANEVLTNIFKHAFKGKEKGEITIQLTKQEEANLAKLIIKDNGKGLPVDFEPEKSESLGLTLINMLAGQIAAEYNFHSDHTGTTFSLDIVI